MPRSALTDLQKQQGLALAQAIKERRLADGRSAEHIAIQAEVSVETVRRIERGQILNPGVFTVAAIARVLDVALDHLTRLALEPRGDA